MSRATDLSVRNQIVQLKLSGKPLQLISRELLIPFSTVRRIWRRYRDMGPKGLAVNYSNCGQHFNLTANLMYRAACYLKYLHPQWGAPLIRVLLKERYTRRGFKIASTRTLQRWFRQKGYNPPRSKPPKEPPIKAGKVHQVWQIDAKEKVLLGSGQKICWLTVTDEHSSGLLAAQAFSP